MKFHLTEFRGNPISLLLLIVIFLISCQSFAIDRLVNVTVVDAEGVPISDAVVSASFPAKNPINSRQKVARTNSAGFAVLKGKSKYKIGVRVEKAGFYTSRVLDHSGDRKLDFDILLRDIRNPVAMYVKNAELNFPQLDAEFGFDFQAGDWVAPFGIGKTTDLIMYAKMQKSDPLNIKISVVFRFSNALDGIRSEPLSSGKRTSSFPSIYLAPESGYSSNLKYVLESDSSTNSNISNQAYTVFRVRTQAVDGQIVSSNYGKIYPLIQFMIDRHEQLGINFTYYFNPIKNDRNLEFDVRRNLFLNDGESKTKFDP